MADQPTDYTKLYGQGYDNLNDAAEAANYEFSHFPDNGERERATIIYKDKRSGKIYRTPPIGGGSSAVSLQNVFDQLANDQIPLAILHNHPIPSRGQPRDINDFLSDADSRTGTGNGLDQNKKPTPITTTRGPTGPLKMFLIRPDGTLAEASGQWKKKSYIDDQKQVAYHDFQSTDPTMGQVPIDEIKQRLLTHLANTSGIAPDLKKQMMMRLLQPATESAALWSPPQ